MKQPSARRTGLFEFRSNRFVFNDPIYIARACNGSMSHYIYHYRRIDSRRDSTFFGEETSNGLVLTMVMMSVRGDILSWQKIKKNISTTGPFSLRMAVGS